jgi:pantothenate kinase
MEYEININGYDVHARYSEDSIEKIWKPLLGELSALQRSLGRRILVMLAAPPGAGKSTLVSFLEYLSKSSDEYVGLQAIGMDGFHHYQDYLMERGLVQIKGAPVTFDLEALAARVARVAAGEVVGWPVYDRNLHNPVEDVITVDSDIVLLEGNYLLLDEPGWRELKAMADYTIFLTADEGMLWDRLVERKAKNTQLEQARAFVENSDMPNARAVLGNSVAADLVVRVLDDGEFEVE